MSEHAKKYRKKPVVIEAMRLQYDNVGEVMRWMNCDAENGESDDIGLYIRTLEGIMSASVGDYIIRGVNGEFYPCKPEIFHKTYEQVGVSHG